LGAAYYRAGQREFASGGEFGDWIKAERGQSQALLPE
jgi:hypothetical protein